MCAARARRARARSRPAARLPDPPSPRPAHDAQREGDVSNLCFRAANLTADTLVAVVEYCKYHADDATASRAAEKQARDWDERFVARDDMSLWELLSAANFLHIQALYDLVTCAIAKRVDGAPGFPFDD